MAFDGNGNFIRLHNWTSDAANNIDINAGEMDGEDNGFAAGLTLCVTRDGQGKMAADFTPASNGIYNLGTGARTWLALNALAGILGPPGSAIDTLTLNQLAGRFGLTLNGVSTAGQSFGARIFAGTNAADAAFEVFSAAVAQYFLIYGDGGVVVGAPAGGDPGPGGLNVQTALQLAGNPVYAGIPQNLQTANYQLVLADANKHIFFNAGAHALTIPANASVPFPVGTAVTFVNNGSGAWTIGITTDQLVWAAGGTTGTRTLALNGMATMIKTQATQWFISGTGLS
jgi:hypothetical protein